MSLWFLSERWVYLRHEGKKWASDVVSDAQHRLLNLPGINRTRKLFRLLFSSLGHAKEEANRLTEKVGDAIMQRSSMDTNEDVEANGNGTSPAMSSASPDFTKLRGSADLPSPLLPSSSFNSEPPPSERHTDTPRAKILWQNAIRTVRMKSAVTSNLAALPKTPRRRSSAHDPKSPVDRRKTLLEEPVRAFARVKQLQPKVQSLEITQDIPAHQGLVRHLQFSPDGRYLATSRSVLVSKFIMQS